MEWITRTLMCDGAIIAGPLDTGSLEDSDLRDLCWRMHMIMQTIEMPRAEGRLMPMALFDAIDTLESMIRQHQPDPAGRSSPPRLGEWLDVIREFGEYYRLSGHGPVNVDSMAYSDAVRRYNAPE
jgi:hypothetical protein